MAKHGPQRFPEAGRRRRRRRRRRVPAGRIDQASARASDSIRRAAGGVQPGNRRLVQQRVLHVPGGLRDLGAHARGASEDHSRQSVAPGEPGTVVRARPGRRARVVQPRSDHHAAAAHGRARQGRLRAGHLGGSVVEPCGSAAPAARERSGQSRLPAQRGRARAPRARLRTLHGTAGFAALAALRLRSSTARCTPPTSACSESSTCRTTTCGTRAICCPSAPTFSAHGSHRSITASATATVDRGGRVCAGASCRSSHACRSAAQRPTSGSRRGPARKVCWRSGSRIAS